MVFAAAAGEFNLFLAFAKSGFVCFRCFANALMATDADSEFRAFQVFGKQGTAAGVAQLMRADLQSVTDTDAVVEDKTVALPRALFLGHLFKVF